MSNKLVSFRIDTEQYKNLEKLAKNKIFLLVNIPES